ncbi:YfiR/HmsC family protein [Fluviicola taffensis]|uniref:YfiR/HmsC family protein n=1 Tax=Fluviicola taffensis TaxID=191579 RepID=UPI0031382C7F
MNNIALTGLFANRLKGIYALLLACFALTFNTSAQFSRSDESIATSMYIIMLNTTWENQASFQTFQIGVLDSDTSFYSVIRKKYEGISLKGKKVSVVHFKNLEAINPTQILCVDKKFNKKSEKIAKAISGNHTLLITNSMKDDECEMVNFNGRLKKDDFTVNQENMEKAGLKLTNQFENYMEGTVQWEQLLTESMEKLDKEREKLDKEREKVAAKDQTIQGQKAKINYQQMTLKEKVKMLDEQSSILEEQNQKLESQTRAISDQEDILFNQKRSIEEQKGKINEQLQKLGMQRVILIMGFVVLLLILGTVYVLYRSSVHRKKSMVQLSEQHAIVSGQKDQIEKILFELTDSIRYALRIQNAVLPNEQTIKGTIPGEFFVMFKPKDIVSGDFFFVDRRGDWTLVAVADCTGHGVPGAFVSMLCISLLNEIVKQQEITRADIILNELRDKVIDSLQQKGIQGEQMDGMDISLLLINNKTLKCHWSGANNPLYIVSSKSNKLEELKPDKRPIAIYPDMKEFTNHEITAKRGDIFYLFTDGYSDQFGGERGKKFMSRNFKNLLAENSHKPMIEQGQILDSTMENWKYANGSDFEQIDDITVLGIRIG